MKSGRHQTGDMGHINHDHGAHVIGNRAEPGKIDDARIGTGADNYHLRLMLAGKVLNFVVIDGFRFLRNTIKHHVEQFAGEVGRTAVGQVAPMGKVHAEDGVPRLQRRKVDGHVRLGTGVGLNVNMVGAKQLLGAFNGKILHHIDLTASTIVAFSRVPFRILVGHDRPLGLQHCLGNKILRCDEFQIIFLPLGLQADGLRDFRIKRFQVSTSLSPSLLVKNKRDLSSPVYFSFSFSAQTTLLPSHRRLPVHFLFQFCDFIKAALVTSPLEFGVQPGSNHFTRLFLVDYPSTEHQNVCIVVLLCHLCHKGIGDKRRPDPGKFVCYDGHPYSRTADQHTLFAATR